jgi:hypothetical protein
VALGATIAPITTTIIMFITFITFITFTPGSADAAPGMGTPAGKG